MILTQLSIALAVLLLLTQCGIGFVDPATDPLLVPVANAGADVTVQQQLSVQLDGTQSYDAKGNAITYSWTQTSGTEVTLSDATSVAPTFTAPASAATLVFELTVSNAEYSGTDTVTVNIIADPTLKGPFASLSASNIQLFDNASLSNEAIDTQITSPYQANELTVTGTITASNGAMFIRCNKLILNSSPTFSVNGTVGGSVVGTGDGADGGAGRGSGGGGGGGATAGGGGAGGSDGAGSAGVAGPSTAGSGGARAGASYTSGYTYGNGGDGGAGEGGAGGGAGGSGGSGFDGGGGGGGGGGGAPGGGSRGGGGGGGGGGLLVIVCNSIEGTGLVSAIGGNGGTSQINGGDGGGGGGGVVWTSFGTYSNQLTAQATGGSSTSGTAGEDGSTVIEDFNGNSQSYSGSW